MAKETKENLVNFTKNNYNVMACSPLKMKGLCKDVIKHKLNLKKVAKLVKQRKRNFAPKRQEEIKEVNRLLDANFFTKMMYPD